MNIYEAIDYCRMACSRAEKEANIPSISHAERHLREMANRMLAEYPHAELKDKDEQE